MKQPLIASIAFYALMATVALVIASILHERSQAQATTIAPRSVSLGEYRVSAYCPCKACCNKNPDHPLFLVTNSEYKIRFGDRLVAAPSAIAFLTVLDIPGYGSAVPVLDRGGAIKGQRLDVLFYERSPDNRTDLQYSHQLALNWGVQDLTITQLSQ